jgi:hypothetical protein
MGSNRGASGRGDGYLGKRPGLFLHQADGRPVPKKTLDAAWQRAHKEIPEFADAAFHGLRGTRVVELRGRGATTLQIQDTVGMSIRMVEPTAGLQTRRLTQWPRWSSSGRNGSRMVIVKFYSAKPER